jgi:hypothetical protein
MKNCEAKTLVSEWNSKGEDKLDYETHGEGDGVDTAAFMARVQGIMEKDHPPLTT